MTINNEKKYLGYWLTMLTIEDIETQENEMEYFYVADVIEPRSVSRMLLSASGTSMISLDSANKGSAKIGDKVKIEKASFDLSCSSKNTMKLVVVSSPVGEMQKMSELDDAALCMIMNVIQIVKTYSVGNENMFEHTFHYLFKKYG